MAANERSKVIQHLRRAVLLKDGAGLTDAQLLEEYLRRREEAALAALVRRHGPMVWGVCRRVLHNYHDAEDAFQATFLVFVRKAASIASPELLANWLYGVAHQTALKARATAAKRKTRERQVKEMPEPAVSENNLWNDLQPLLDQELSRLSDKYRSAIVLCDLEGKTRKEAARQLGVPEGTVAARLARGRKMLAQRLTRHGLTLSAASMAAILAQHTASASMPSVVVGSTIKVASLITAGQAAAAGAISAQAVALMEGVLKTMFLTKLKITTTIVLGMGLLGISWGLYPTRAAAPSEAKQEAFLPPPSELAAEGKEEGDTAKDKQGKRKVGLPKGPAPAQVLVSLDKDGKLVVKADQFVALKVPPPLRMGQAPAPMPGGPQPGPRVVIKGIGGGLGPIAFRPRQGPIELSYDLKEVQVFDTKGKEVGKKELAKLLKEETVAVASFGDQLPDPLHLRILKEGTLVFLLPLPPRDKMPLPDPNQDLFPEFGTATVGQWFFRKQPSNLEPREQCLDLFDDILGPWFFQVLP
jgi:RNA polymerase sigma factor (sigma-70 family)